MNRDLLFVADMVAALRRIQTFIAGMGEDVFLADDKTSSAVQYQLRVIAEAARHVRTQTRADHPEIPWQFLTTLAERLLTPYDAVNLRLVWRTIQDDLPPLQAQLQQLLAEIG